MSYYRFSNDDIINTSIVAHPSYVVSMNGDQVTGSIYLDKPFLEDSLESRVYKGTSAKEGGWISKTGPFTSSIGIVDAERDAENKELYLSIQGLYNHYAIVNSDYTASFDGADTTRFRVITIPEIYYEREILTGSLTASDLDSAGNERNLYDNGRGGIYSGSLTGTLVGNIFYSEGLIVLKGGGLNDEAGSNDFGQASPTNYKWTVSLKGVNTIPVNVFRCRAPAGELNASTNTTFYTVPTLSSSQFKNERVKILSESVTYITQIGMYNDRYELVAVAKLAQPIRKTEGQDLLFRIKYDR